MKITLYVKNGCPQCRMTKIFFDKHHIKYFIKNISNNSAYYQEAEQSPFSATPIIKVNDKMSFCHFDIPKLEQLVKKIES